MIARFGTSRYLRLVGAFLLALDLTACSQFSAITSPPPIRGIVVEDGTGRPLADVTVYIRWTYYGSGAGVDSRSSCVRIDFAKTDAQGRFELPGGDAAGWIDVYKPGYVGYRRINQFGQYADYLPLDQPQRLLMKPFTGTLHERLVYLGGHFGKGCSAEEDYTKKLIPFYRALYEESKEVALKLKNAAKLTKEDIARIRMYLYAVDVLELGRDTAEKKLQERRQKYEY